MRTDFSLFRERLAEACQAADLTETKVCQRIGLGAKHALHLALAGPRAIDVYRLCQIADVLDVSLDWLTGRSNVMSVMEMPEELAPLKKPKGKPKKPN
jgi:transcriptional regulator with XRE-family HTH domain